MNRKLSQDQWRAAGLAIRRRRAEKRSAARRAHSAVFGCRTEIRMIDK
jgi:hypothetical protein